MFGLVDFMVEWPNGQHLSQGRLSVCCICFSLDIRDASRMGIFCLCIVEHSLRCPLGYQSYRYYMCFATLHVTTVCSLLSLLSLLSFFLSF